MKKKTFLTIKTDFQSEIFTISIALHYSKDRMKLDSIIYQIEFEDKKN